MPRPNYGPGLSGTPNPAGYWEITWTEAGRSRRVSTGETSRKKASLFLAGWLQERDTAAERVTRRRPMTVAELLPFYRANHAIEHVNDIERVDYASIPLLTFFGALVPEQIDDTILTDYLSRRRDGSLGRAVQNGTARRELEHLRAVMHFAARNRRATGITPDMVPNITLPAKSQPRARVATDEEMDRLMAAARGVDADARLSRGYRFMALARWSGGRKRAIETLTWQRVDLDAGTVDFREEGRRITSKRRVLVPIDAQLLPILQRAHRERLGALVLDHDMPIRGEFERAAAAAGTPDITPHVFRHTWGTRAAERGLSSFLIATFLGDTTETVERNYMHRSPEYLRRALANFSGLGQDA